jgi:hypothetical protein
MTPTVVENFRLTAALAYAANGWAVFPLHNPKFGPTGIPACSCGKSPCSSLGKHPRTITGLKDASKDADCIRAWWKQWPDANIAIATGEVSGIIVLDVDGEAGKQSLADLMDEHGEFMESVEAETGGGGTHIIFRREEYAIQNSTSKLGPNLDIRGDGGYIVAPPSLHKTNKRYEWLERCAPTERSPISMPYWMIGKLLAKPRTETHDHAPATDSGLHWLGKALAKASFGNRNETGIWLACQLRDSGLNENEARQILWDYADRCPSGDTPYTRREAEASVKSAYSHPARSPASSGQKAMSEYRAGPIPAKEVSKPTNGAAAELGTYLERVINREVYNIHWRFDQLTRLTQALLPGTVTCIVGDAGSGKTFYVLDHMQFWFGNGIPHSVFFIEKDRKFHTMRLLAQLQRDARFVDFTWVANNREEVRAAMARHSTLIDQVGVNIYSQPEDRVTFPLLLKWIREQAEAGMRIIIVDPITAVAAARDRFIEDEQFVLQAQQILNQHECSLVLTTHAKKGRRPNAPTMDDIALGAAYSRFCDTSFWILSLPNPRRVAYKSPCGRTDGTFTKFIQIHKTRNGRGAGQEIAFTFDESLHYSEQGVVIEDLKVSREE